MTEQQPPVTVSGRISEADYVRAQWLHLRPGPIVACVGGLLVATLIAVGVLQLVSWFQGARPLSRVTILPITLLVVPLYYGALSIRFRRSYRAFKAIQAPVKIELSETEFAGRSEHGESHLPWDLFRKVKENDHLLLLYQAGGGLFHILPKRLFAAEEDVARARDLFSRKMSPK